ncbi:N-acetyltransferase [Luteimonas aestuarii]|uniref:N-acetyltransferase n=1 Tax=Luteimonas aestuarii TaxID=453837 RepID=A0A4R5TSP6_9GAMM|nr:GNAT family N-acetyltransferase [Luteimonas aestuarii]TDK23387.1 N-acetyltransferase [Luteimonas aestuarii]
MPTLRVIDALSEIPASQWDTLHDGTHPFVSHAFLHGLEAHGCLRPDWGWTPRHVTLWEGGTLVAAAPNYVKRNSHGEFVFDHAWAHAYAQHGMDYFPKLLCAVPYSPVTGPRLLARDPASRQFLLEALAATAAADGASSVHVNFHREGEDDAFDEAWLRRIDVQYHWRNTAGWTAFDDFLAAMDHKHRKNIRQERRKVAEAGVRFRVVHGDEASKGDIAAMHGFYLQTFAEYGNSPALTLAFLQHLARTTPRNLVLVFAEHGGQQIAGALCLRGGDTLYGRYWGSHATLPGLHFETCYYQGIEYCLREGLRAFEPGAQGEHKIARGFLPTLVRSRHWIAHPGFREALRAWCGDESESVRRYAGLLTARSPFRKP